MHICVHMCAHIYNIQNRAQSYYKNFIYANVLFIFLNFLNILMKKANKKTRVPIRIPLLNRWSKRSYLTKRPAAS